MIGPLPTSSSPVEQGYEPDHQPTNGANKPFADRGLTIVSPYIADWNSTHIYNPRWPPHAKYHNAQTMVRAVLLGFAALGFIWRRGSGSRSALLTGLLFAGLYWVSQAFAFLFPGVAWTDPDLLKPGQSLDEFPLQLKGDIVIFFVLALCAWLIWRGTPDDRRQ